MDGENRGERDRTVVRALRSLEPLTGPTAAERQRIRDRILLTLEEADDPADGRSPAPTAHDEAAFPGSAEESAAAPAAASASTEVEDPPRELEAEGTREAEADDSRRADDPPRVEARRRERQAAVASRPGGARGQVRPRQRDDADRRSVLTGVRGRFAVAALAVLALVGSLAGMSVLLSRDALPGDALYGVKRTAEAASLGLTFGDEPKALKHLEFASSRISEIETLARRYPNPEDAPVGGYLTALSDFDNDATAGSRQLINLATRTDGRLLESLRDWSTQQAGRLQQVAGQLPEAARNRLTTSRAMLDRITARADGLLLRMDCYQITSGSFDDIGALPATAPCEEKPAVTSNPTQPSVPGTTDSPGAPTGPEQPSAPLPPAPPAPEVPPVPVPGATATVPVPTLPPVVTGTTVPETPPLIQVPPLLPGLPTIGIG